MAIPAKTLGEGVKGAHTVLQQLGMRSKKMNICKEGSYKADVKALLRTKLLTMSWN